MWLVVVIDICFFLRKSQFSDFVNFLLPKIVKKKKTTPPTVVWEVFKKACFENGAILKHLWGFAFDILDPFGSMSTYLRLGGCRGWAAGVIRSFFKTKSTAERL